MELPTNQIQTTRMTLDGKNILSTSSILVVDDSKLIREFVSTVLEREGAHVVTTSSGLTALNLCKQHDFDIILIDLRMPDIDGYQTLNMLRAQGIKSPVIAFSAGNELLDEFEDSGFAGFLLKPVQRETLVEQITKLLS